MSIKNVVVVNDFAYVQGGASKIAIETANLLAKNTDLNVFFFTGDNSKNELDKNVAVVSTGQGESLKNKLFGAFTNLYNLKAKRMLLELLKTLNKEETIIHFHGWTKCLSSSIFSPVFKKKFKNVITLHDYFTVCPNGGFFNYVSNSICTYDPLSKECKKCNCDSRSKKFKKFRLLRTYIQNKKIKVQDRIKYAISISDLSEEVLKKYLTNAKFYRIYNPVNIEPINYINDLSAKEKYVYIGRIEKEKGVDDFCEAMTNLDYRGIVVGTGKEEDYLKNKYKKIEFVGWKDEKEIKEILKEAKALVFTSKWYETAGLTILEALSQGVCCYVRSTCAGREFIQEGKNGFLFKDEKELEKKLIENKDFKSISNISIDQFSNEYYLNNLVNAYKTIMED